MRGWFVLVLVAACGRIGFDPSGGDDTPPVITPDSRLDLLVGRHDPAGYADGTGMAARFSHPYATVAVGTTLYVADSGNGTIRAVDLTSGAVTTIGGAPWSASPFNWITGITYLNGTLYLADFDAHVIRSVDPATGTVKLVAGQIDTNGDTDGPALGTATFTNPVGITTDGTDLFVVEFLGNRVRRIAMSTGQVSLLAGGVDGAMDGVGAAAQFHYPWSISYVAGVLYVGDLNNRTVRTIDPATATVASLVMAFDGTLQSATAAGADVYFANVGTIWDYNTNVSSNNRFAGYIWSSGTLDGDASTVLFRNPRGLAVAGTQLYVADTDNSAIRAIDLTTQITATFAGNYEPTAGPVDGVGAAARFDQLNGIATDGTRIWVTDENNYTIREIDPVTRTSTLIAGSGTAYGTTDGTGSNALFHRPAGITYGDDGMLYDVDRDSHRLRRIDPTTHEVVTIGGPDEYDGPGDVIYAGGVLYVADEAGERILRVDPATGVVTPIAGGRGTNGEQDGIGTAAQFYAPRGLSMCGGMLYVADRVGGTIRRVDPATGAVTTWIRHASSAQDGPIATARVVTPTGTTCDADELYIADAGAAAVRRIDFATETVSTVVGTFGRAEDHDDVLASASTNTPLAVRIVGGKLVILNASNLRIIH